MGNYRLLKILMIPLIVFLFSCGSIRKISSRKMLTNRDIKTNEISNNIDNISIKETVEVEKKFLINDQKVINYIKKYSETAKVEMRKYGIPVSITIAQGVLESGIGEGRLAKLGNNHFGIKCHKKWKGKRMYHDDDRRGECFRVYKDPGLSYRDHSIFLKTRSRYDFLFDLKKTNYKAWARGLKKAGYATDPKYPDKLISLIERYRLDRFDKSILKIIDLNNEIFHKVKKGDTLYSISKKYNVSIEKIVDYNNIQGTKISLGQILKIP